MTWPTRLNFHYHSYKCVFISSFSLFTIPCSWQLYSTTACSTFAVDTTRAQVTLSSYSSLRTNVVKNLPHQKLRYLLVQKNSKRTFPNKTHFCFTTHTPCLVKGIIPAQVNKADTNSKTEKQ